MSATEAEAETASSSAGDPRHGAAGPDADAPPRWFEELRQAAQALRELAAAQWDLFHAELRLARAAAVTSLLAALVAAVFAVALGFTLLALLGWALAHWFDSWMWALVALVVLQALVVGAALLLFRRCLHWLSLPATRRQWRSLLRDAAPRSTTGRRQARAAQGEGSTDGHTSPTG